MTIDTMFTEDEMVVDAGLGYPRAYGKMCRDRSFGPFSHGPPFTYTPYALVQQEDSRAKELDEMFPIIDPKAKPTTKPKIFAGLLWKQLNHLGNAGFNPETFRVDPYGNVLYFHADAASPLAWDIDHWFPCARGGLTVPSNLRILQWQVCKRKHNKLDFLIPWWDVQVGISINQFLSIFASSSSDFRHRAFSWLFFEGECEELNATQTVDSHTFPQHFLESKAKLGLAPAAVVLSRRESLDAPLRTLDVNRRPRSTHIVAAKKMKQITKENEDPLMETNPYQAIVMARDSLKQREETVKMQTEIQRLDNEVNQWQQKTEEEKVSVQDLELMLFKKRRRAEKCRRLAESQSSYRAMLEKMIRDAMHQSVVYKEQVRLNQAASSALLARLEAQKEICDTAERDLHRKYRQRDELEKQVRPEWEQARKRSRMDDDTHSDDSDKLALCLPENEAPELLQEIETKDAKKTTIHLPELKSAAAAQHFPEIAAARHLPEIKAAAAPLHKELREFLEEEQVTSSEECLVLSEQQKQKSIEISKRSMDKRKSIVVEGESSCMAEERFENFEQQMQKAIEISKRGMDKKKAIVVEGESSYMAEQRFENFEQQKQKAIEISKYGMNKKKATVVEGEDSYTVEERLGDFEMQDGGKIYNIEFPCYRKTDKDEDEESRQQRGKGNIEKWMQFLLENTPEDGADLNPPTNEERKIVREDKFVENLNLVYPHTDARASRAGKHPILCKDEVKEGCVEPEIRNSTPQREADEGKKHFFGGKMTKTSTPFKNPPYRIGPERAKAMESISIDKEARRISSSDDYMIKERTGKEKDLKRSESARAFRRIPSSPSLIFQGMKKRVDCIGKKPLVLDDNDSGDDRRRSSFVKSSIKSIKQAVRI